MPIKAIAPTDAVALMKQGARLIDIRSVDEFRRSSAHGAESQPLDTLGALEADTPVLFMCKSGMRTTGNAERLQARCLGDAYLIEGGLDAWRQAGLPINEDASQPIEIMRQVQIAAGMLILIGALLGATTTPAWHGLSAFVGAGLLFAGTTGWCGMARLLAMMPWNQRGAV